MYYIIYTDQCYIYLYFNDLETFKTREIFIYFIKLFIFIYKYVIKNTYLS